MSWFGKKCLVTGGASFIGSHLSERLVTEGAVVRVADDLSSGRKEHLATVASEVEFFQGDLRDQNFARIAVAGCDTVFHLAADHGGRGYIASHPADCAANMALDNIVFREAHRAGVERILFASSACVYPTNLQDSRQLLSEDMVDFSRPGGAFADEEYGWAKLMGEMSLRAYHRQYGIHAACARISTAYGPRENESHAVIALIAKAFIRQTPFEIWGDGEQTRGFTYVDDVVEGLLGAVKHISDGGAVNVGSDEFISINQICAEIFRQMGWYPPDGVHHLHTAEVGVTHRALDGRRAQAVTGWRPRVDLARGLAKTIAWYTEHHDRDVVAASLAQRLNSR